jgi:hypothetical protein
MTAGRRRQARAARAQVEDVIDARGGQWARSLSLLLDLWLIVEEAA